MNEFCLTETQLLVNSLFNLEKILRMSGLNNRSTEKKKLAMPAWTGLDCSANQLAGFYMLGKLVAKGLNYSLFSIFKKYIRIIHSCHTLSKDFDVKEDCS